MKSNEVTCPHCKKAMRYDATICPHCRTVATEGELAKRKDDDKWNTYGGLAVLVIGCLALAYCTSGDNDAEQRGYTVPSTVKTSREISKRLADAVPTSIEEARQFAYEHARTNWGDNKAGPPSDAKVALAIQMIDEDALTDPELADPKLRLVRYNTAVTLFHCNNPTACGYK